MDFNIKLVSDLTVGKAIHNQKQMASDLGLSMQSISLALRDQRGVSEATRARVKAHAASLGYQPDAGLRALADYRTERTSRRQPMESGGLGA